MRQTLSNSAFYHSLPREVTLKTVKLLTVLLPVIVSLTSLPPPPSLVCTVSHAFFIPEEILHSSTVFHCKPWLKPDKLCGAAYASVFAHINTCATFHFLSKMNILNVYN